MKKLNYVIWCAWRFKKRKKESFAWKRGHIFLFFNFDKLKVFFFDLWRVELRVRPRMLSYVAVCVFTITDTVDCDFHRKAALICWCWAWNVRLAPGLEDVRSTVGESPNLWPLIWHSNIPFNVRKQTCGGNARTFARASENFFGSPRTTLITRASRSNPWPSI